MEAGVETTDAVTLDDLLERLDGADTRLVAQRGVFYGVRRRLGASRHENGGLNYVFRQFKRAYANQLSATPETCIIGNLHAMGDVERPATIPPSVNVNIVANVGVLPGVL